MKVEFLAKFNKDIDKIHQKSVKETLLKIIDQCESASSISDISNMKKLKGFKNAYRILGDYRLGLFIEKTTVQFARIAHRKDIYNIFP